VQVLPYSQFEQALREGRVAEVQVVGSLVVGTLKVPQDGGRRALAAELVEPVLAQRLSEFGVTFSRVRESTWLSQLWSWVAPAVIFFGVWTLLSQRLASSSTNWTPWARRVAPSPWPVAMTSANRR